MHSIVQAFGTIRAPLFVALFTAAILLLVGQSGEIVQAILQAPARDRTVQIAKAVAGAALLAAILLISSVCLIHRAAAWRAAAVARHRLVLSSSAVAIAATPFICLALASIRVGTGRPTYVNEFVWTRTASFLVWAAITVFIVVLLVPFRRLSTRDPLAIEPRARPVGTAAAILGALLVLAALAAIIWVATTDPFRLAAVLGPVLVIMLFSSFLCLFISLATYVYDRYQIPALTVLIALAAVSAAAGLNQNRDIRVLASPETPKPALPVATNAFAAWLAARPDLDADRTRPYPVYLVAAEGGGLYAAAHVAIALARIQDSCPVFARHVFAISGVSGGSLGAALFSSLVKAAPAPPGTIGCPPDLLFDGPLQVASRRYVENDFLTPLMSAALFPDFLQQVLPWPVPHFDRARALERTFEAAWADVARSVGASDTEQFGRAFESHWAPGGDAPALLLNATRVSTGTRIVVAPFALKSVSIDPDIDLVSNSMTLPLSTAISLSARFPFVTPAGWISGKGGKNPTQLADGGYFENTGIETIRYLAEGIRKAASEHDGKDPDATATGACAKDNVAHVRLPSGRVRSVCFKFIVFLGTFDPLRFRAPLPVDEFRVPLATAFRARTARTSHVLSDTRRAFCGGELCGRGQKAIDPHIYFSFLAIDDLTLGWSLSRDKLKRISERIVGPRACVLGPTGVSDVLRLQGEENACLYTRIRADLLRRNLP